MILRPLQGAGFEVTVVGQSLHALMAVEAEAVILVFGSAPERLVRFFAQCTETFRLLPILGVGDLSPIHIVELLRCGMFDFATLPLDGSLLRRKVDRLVLRAAGTVVESPILAALPKSLQLGRRENERKCARAPVSSLCPASVKIGTEPALVKLTDISVLTDAAPGGMSLFLDQATGKRLDALKWTSTTMLVLSIVLPADISSQPVPARARVVRVAARTNATLFVAMQYWLDRVRDETMLQRFWMRCQMTSAKAAATKRATEGRGGPTAAR